MTTVRIFTAVCASALLAGCADIATLGKLSDEFGIGAQPSEEYLAEKCPAHRESLHWIKQCTAWRSEREAEKEERRRSQEAAREAERLAQATAYRQEQERVRREAEQLEIAAIQQDERLGYKHLSFEDFALDGERMIGAKVAMQGVYVGEGKRLAHSQLAALMWIERGQSPKGTLIPLVTADAARDSRALLLRCDQSPIGCGVVIRGRVRMLTLQNAFGAQSKQLGLVVESTR